MIAADYNDVCSHINLTFLIIEPNIFFLIVYLGSLSSFLYIR